MIILSPDKVSKSRIIASMSQKNLRLEPQASCASRGGCQFLRSQALRASRISPQPGPLRAQGSEGGSAQMQPNVQRMNPPPFPPSSPSRVLASHTPRAGAARCVRHPPHSPRPVLSSELSPPGGPSTMQATSPSGLRPARLGVRQPLPHLDPGTFPPMPSDSPASSAEDLPWLPY